MSGPFQVAYNCALVEYRALSEKYKKLSLPEFFKEVGGLPPDTNYNSSAKRSALLLVLNERKGYVKEDGSLKDGRELEQIIELVIEEAA